MKGCEDLIMNNGLKIPQIGFGTYKITPNDKCEKACLEAIKVGYRHLDTAHLYENERGVGEAIKKCGLKREELYIVSKVWPTSFGIEETQKCIDLMLKRLDLTYIDLVLLHWPFGDYIGAWKGMEKCVKDGKIKSIGLSNFYEKELKEILDICTIKPVLNQVECHPCRNQEELKKMCDKEKIILEAWMPIARFKDEVMNDPTIKKCAEKYKKSPSQVVLRWHIQRGVLPIPKSENPIHMKENYDIFDFKLENEEVELITKNVPQLTIWKPRTGDMESFIKWSLEHPPKDN